jgi:hypothetical protein
MNKIVVGLLFFVLMFVGFFIYVNKNSASVINQDKNESIEYVENKSKDVEEIITNTHLQTPEPLKSVYMSACAAATPSYREHLISLIEKTELNAIIIDVKDFSGTITIPTELEGKNGTGCKVPDMKEFLDILRSKNIYTIARITVFQDPHYSKIHPELAVKKASDGSVWKDFKGLSFIEVGAKPYWDYIVDLSYQSYDIGFDEINFDYVRFPSDGNMKDIYFPNLGSKSKAEALEEFFAYLGSRMKDPTSPRLRGTRIPTSVDLFGMTTTNTDDLNIGQVLERALPHFDYVAPMVYPSHYPANFNGWANPDDYVYETVHFAMSSAVERVNALKNATTTPQEVRDHLNPLQLRTWIQDFDYGGNYDIPEVQEQIKATYDAGLTSWMVWDPSNRYTEGAYKLE